MSNNVHYGDVTFENYPVEGNGWTYHAAFWPDTDDAPGGTVEDQLEWIEEGILDHDPDAEILARHTDGPACCWVEFKDCNGRRREFTAAGNVFQVFEVGDSWNYGELPADADLQKWVDDMVAWVTKGAAKLGVTNPRVDTDVDGSRAQVCVSWEATPEVEKYMEENDGDLPEEWEEWLIPNDPDGWFGVDRGAVRRGGYWGYYG